MSEDEFIALLKEKLYATTDDKKRRSKKAEFDKDTLLQFAAAAIKAGPAGGLQALKVLWEKHFQGAPNAEENKDAQD